MKKLLAVLVAGLVSAGAFAHEAPAVVVPTQSVHSVAYVVKHHPKRYVRHQVVHHPRHRAPVRHRRM